jgi:hypothetical protein
MSDEGAGAFLGRLTVKLADAGVPSMVVGSFASSFHGVPRSSQDLDLVIDPQPESLRRFLADLPPADYYADADAALDALHRRGQQGSTRVPASVPDHHPGTQRHAI